MDEGDRQIYNHSWNRTPFSTDKAARQNKTVKI